MEYGQLTANFLKETQNVAELVSVTFIQPCAFFVYFRLQYLKHEDAGICVMPNWDFFLEPVVFQ